MALKTYELTYSMLEEEDRVSHWKFTVFNATDPDDAIDKFKTHMTAALARKGHPDPAGDYERDFRLLGVKRLIEKAHPELDDPDEGEAVFVPPPYVDEDEP